MTPDEELAEIKLCVEDAIEGLTGYIGPFSDGEQRQVKRLDDGTWLFGPSRFSQARERRVQVIVHVEDVERTGRAPDQETLRVLRKALEDARQRAGEDDEVLAKWGTPETGEAPATFSLRQNPDYVRLTPQAVSQPPRCPYPLDADGGCSHHLDDVCQRSVPKRREDDRAVGAAYVELATRLLAHPDVVQAFALRLEAEGL